MPVCSNDYDYVSADPANLYDLDGQAIWVPVIMACVRFCRAAYAAGRGARLVKPARTGVQRLGQMFAKAKKSKAKNADRQGHSGGRNWDKHSKAQGHGGKSKFPNPNKRRPGPEPA